MGWLSRLLVMVCFGVVGSVLGGTYGGGSGTEEEPYQIWTAEQMNEIGLNEEDWDKCFVLMDDIDMGDLSGVDYNAIGWYVGTRENHPFSGVFDGRGKIIRNFSYSAPEGHCVGLFAYVKGEVKHLGLENINIDAPGGSYVGGLAGHSHNSRITCCFTKGYVGGDSCVGGLIGYSSASRVSDCYSEAAVSGRFAAGGLVGYWRRTQWVYDCYSSGELLRGGGGFCGFTDDKNSSDIENCFWDVESSGTSYDAQGAQGLATSQMQNPGTFVAAGWDLTISLDEPWRIWGKQSEGEYPRLWFETPGSYPLPQFAGGSGTSSNPYLIASTGDLNSIAHDPRLMDKAFRLIDDIDLDETSLNVIGQQLPFEGSFEGMGYTVRNIGSFVDSDRDVGLFGIIGRLGRVCNVILEDVHIDTVNASCVGGLAGVCYGKISNCSSDGSVRGLRLVGGLVGSAEGAILRSSARGSVSGRFTVGGLCGSGDAVIEDCYSQSSVEGETLVGGLVGHTSNGTFSCCYAAGNINGFESIGGLVGENSGANISSCFWDVDASGIVESAGGIGKTAGEMKQRSSFAGWDFVGETVNGIEDIWFILQGDYPRLWWEFIPVLHTEPELTLGTSNIISWEPVAGNVEYYVECAEDPNFTGIIYNSGWIAETSCEFIDLQLGQQYWYRVRAGNAAGVETGWSNVESSLQSTLGDAVDMLLDPVSLKNENMKNALLNKIDAAMAMIEGGNYTGALSKLEHDILAKTNGCAETGEPDKNDWILACQQQSQVYGLVMESIEYVRSLIE